MTNALLPAFAKGFALSSGSSPPSAPRSCSCSGRALGASMSGLSCFLRGCRCHADRGRGQRSRQRASARAGAGDGAEHGRCGVPRLVRRLGASAVCPSFRHGRRPSGGHDARYRSRGHGGFHLFNPHVYIDTVLLMGAAGTSLPPELQVVDRGCGFAARKHFPRLSKQQRTAIP